MNGASLGSSPFPCARVARHRCVGRGAGRLSRPRAEPARHPGPALHRRAGRPGRRPAERTGAQRARQLHRQERRHAVGHLPHVPHQPVALARAVGHEHAGSAQPAPHLPGQQLVPREDQRPARLRMQGQGGPAASAPTETVRVSPRTRIEALADAALPTLQPHLIEPFLAEPVIVAQGTLDARRASWPAPRTACCSRAATAPTPAAATARRWRARPTGPLEEFRVFRNAVPLRDPVTRAVLGYEAQYLGKAALVRGESTKPSRCGRQGPPDRGAGHARHRVRPQRDARRRPPAARAARQLVSYAPRAPVHPGRRPDGLHLRRRGAAGRPEPGRGHQQGHADGIDSGHVLAILRRGARPRRPHPARQVSDIKLPNERNGLLMVFRPFEHLSYALVLDSTEGVQVGDRIVNPRCGAASRTRRGARRTRRLAAPFTDARRRPRHGPAPAGRLRAARSALRPDRRRARREVVSPPPGRIPASRPAGLQAQVERTWSWLQPTRRSTAAC
jgi:hypothetical protein